VQTASVKKNRVSFIDCLFLVDEGLDTSRGTIRQQIAPL
jgi:hypothetical protein